MKQGKKFAARKRARARAERALLRRGPAMRPEDAVLREWTQLLSSNAKVYTGMFNSLRRAADGAAKKPEKVLREWCARSVYKWPGSEAERLCREYLLPVAEAADVVECAKWAKLLLEAAQAAGITAETAQKRMLDEDGVRAYTEWDGQELYPDSCVRIITPAWYQNGAVIEQGMASLL